MLVSNGQFAVYALCAIIGGILALYARGWVERVLGIFVFGAIVAITWMSNIAWVIWFGPPAWAAFLMFTILSLMYAESERIDAHEPSSTT